MEDPQKDIANNGERRLFQGIMREIARSLPSGETGKDEYGILPITNIQDKQREKCGRSI